MEFNTHPPLSQGILEEPIPTQFKISQLEPYDSTSDLLDHLERYKDLMLR